MNHRGPLPLRELHSTDETLVWRDPGGSWACSPLWVKSARLSRSYVSPTSYTSHAGFFFYLECFSYTSHAGFSFYVGSFSGMQSSLKTTPKQKSWVKDGPEKKCWKITLKTEKEPYNTLYRAEQNQNWVTNGHRKERGIKEMDPSSEQALAEKAKN